MTGIVSGVDYSVLYSGSGAGVTSPAGNLLATRYGLASAGAGAANKGDPIAALSAAQKNQAREVAAQAKTTDVARDIAAFQKAVGGAKTIQEALRNPDILKVLLTANNLGDQAGYPALAQKALLSDPNDADSLANKLAATNANWLAAARTYNFAGKGLAALQDPKVQASLSNAYAEISWRNGLDSRTAGLSNALSFIKQAASITSVDQILGDKVNRDVVLTALGIPKQIAFQSLTAQEAEVARYIDVRKLQDPKFVTSLTDQYLLNKQSEANASATSGSIATLAARATSLIA